jgi:hypothetical protein
VVHQILVVIYLSALIGPVAGGFMVDMIGFEMATFIIVLMFLFVVRFKKNKSTVN